MKRNGTKRNKTKRNGKKRHCTMPYYVLFSETERYCIERFFDVYSITRTCMHMRTHTLNTHTCTHRKVTLMCCVGVFLCTFISFKDFQKYFACTFVYRPLQSLSMMCTCTSHNPCTHSISLMPRPHPQRGKGFGDN